MSNIPLILRLFLSICRDRHFFKSKVIKFATFIKTRSGGSQAVLTMLKNCTIGMDRLPLVPILNKSNFGSPFYVVKVPFLLKIGSP